MNYFKILSQLQKTPRVHGYISPKTETKISPIQGLGLFAKKDIKKGEIVAAWGGCVATKEEIKKLPKDIGFHYALELYPGLYLAERKISELDSADFINHSCSANCEIIDRFIMKANKEIKKDTELTADFGSNKKTRNYFICNCSSKKCRGKIYFN